MDSQDLPINQPVARGQRDIAPAHIDDLIQRAETGMRPIAADWAQNKLYDRGRQFLEADRYGNVLLQNRPDDIKRIVVNLFQDQKAAMVAKLCANRPQVAITPATSSSDDRAAAREEEWLVQYFWRSRQLQTELVYAVSDAVDCGGGWWQVAWDENAGQDISVQDESVTDLDALEQESPTRKSGDLVVRFVSNLEMRVDPAAVRLSDAMWIARVHYMDVDVVHDRWGKKVPADVAGTRPMIPGVEWILNPQRNFDDNICRVVEFWHKPLGPKYPNGLYMVYSGSTVLEKVQELPLGDFPFDYFQLRPDPDNFYGTTPASSARRPQREMNVGLSITADGMTRGGAGAWLADRQAGMDKPTGAPQEVLTYNANAREPKFVQPQPVAEQMLRIVDVFASLVPQTFGMTQLAQTTSGKDRLYASEQDNTKLGPIVNEIQEFLKRIVMRMLRTWQAFASEDIQYAAGDPNATSDVRSFQASQIRFGNVEMSIDSSLPLNREARREHLIAMYQSGLLERDRVLALLEFGEIDDALGSRNLDRERARQENQDIYVREMPVFEWEDHAAHLEEHLGEIKQRRCYEDPDAQMRLQNHMAMHKQFLAAALGVAAPANNPLTTGAPSPQTSAVPENSAGAVESLVPMQTPLSARDNMAMGVINGRHLGMPEATHG